MEDQKTTDLLDEIATTEVDVTEVTEESGEGGLGKVFLGLTIVAGVGGYLWYKTKDKREQRAIEKLRKKGYEVIEPVVEEDEIEDAEFVEAEEVESEEKK